MKWEDLPESTNVEDRRGEKDPLRKLTFKEMVERAKTTKPIPPNLPIDINDPLAVALGILDISKSHNTLPNTKSNP